MRYLVFFLIISFALPVYGDQKPVEKDPSDKILLLNVATEVRFEEKGVTYSRLEWALVTAWAFEDEDGKWIVTAGHIVRFDADRVKNVSCIFKSGKKNPEELSLVGYDHRIDTALLKCVDPEANKDLPVLELGNSSNLKAGQKVFSFGHPFPFRWIVTAGIINDPNFIPCITDYNHPSVHFVVHDSKVNRGSSGSPLLDENGKVIGVNIELREHFSAAVPIDDIKFLMSSLKKGGEVRHPPINLIFNYSGYFIDALLNFWGVEKRPDSEGLMVTAVKKNTLADYSDFRMGDVIISVDGKEPKDLMDLYKMIYFRTSLAEIIKVKIKRDGQEREMPLILLLDNFKKE